MRAKHSCFGSFIPFFCKNMRSGNSVSDLISKGFSRFWTSLLRKMEVTKAAFSNMPFLLKQYALSLPEKRLIAKQGKTNGTNSCS